MANGQKPPLTYEDAEISPPAGTAPEQFKSPLRHVWVAGRLWMPLEDARCRPKALDAVENFGLSDG